MSTVAVCYTRGFKRLNLVSEYEPNDPNDIQSQAKRLINGTNVLFFHGGKNPVVTNTTKGKKTTNNQQAGHNLFTVYL